MATTYPRASEDRAVSLARAIQFTWREIDKILADVHGPEYRSQIYAQSVHHYTDLNACRFLIETGNVWLSDARYCNDRQEIEHARTIIERVFNDLLGHSGFTSPTTGGPVTLLPGEDQALRGAQANYGTQIHDFIAFVACFCAGNGGLRHPQDILSQWRAYGSNGNGGCVSFNAGSIEQAISQAPAQPANPNGRLPGFLFEPILYDDGAQQRLIEAHVENAIDEGRQTGSINVGQLTDILLMISPLMKHYGFREEQEWRIVCLPQFTGSLIAPRFRARPDLLVPYVDTLIVLNRAPVVTEVMVGPSNIPELNEQAMARVPNAPAVIFRSEIPYRI